MNEAISVWWAHKMRFMKTVQVQIHTQILQLCLIFDAGCCEEPFHEPLTHTIWVKFKWLHSSQFNRFLYKKNSKTFYLMTWSNVQNMDHGWIDKLRGTPLSYGKKKIYTGMYIHVYYYFNMDIIMATNTYHYSFTLVHRISQL